MSDHKLKAPIIFTLIAAVVFLAIGIFGTIFLQNSENGFLDIKKSSFEKFATEEEFREYLSSAPEGRSSFEDRDFIPLSLPGLLADQESGTFAAQKASPERISATNVQVAGIDEPDIVKTDGKNIFFSSENYSAYGRFEPFVQQELAPVDRGILPMPDYAPPSTKIINALPAEQISIAGEADATGDLLVSGNVMVVFRHDSVLGFDISDPKKPVKSWQHDLEENTGYTAARLLDGQIYLITTRFTDYGMPCPMPLFTNSLSVSCTDIYRVNRPISIDSVYSILRIDPTNGNVADSTSFVGSSSQSVVYVSPQAIYATFTSYPAELELTSNFFSQNTDLLGSEIDERISKLTGLDISQESKLNELNIIIQKHLSSLSKDESARVRNEITDRMTDYLKDHGRKLQRTSIVKIDKDTLDVSAMGEVPGAPLNQFSLDEYGGNLRIATTLSASTMFGSIESENDVYVLDPSLNVIGQIQGLALGERVYSSRFMGDRAYIVTFKQIDPFFVIDLSSPTAPSVAGELKIPGFSSYLHPLSGNLILGVGQEDGKSKLSIFDVSNPKTPIEVDKYTFDEYWSEVQNNHHAFLGDPENKVFFMPAGQSGYIFSYKDGLKLERVVSDISAVRAVYINNYFYIIGNEKVVVLNNANWEEVGNLSF